MSFFLKKKIINFINNKKILIKKIVLKKFIKASKKKEITNIIKRIPYNLISKNIKNYLFKNRNNFINNEKSFLSSNIFKNVLLKKTKLNNVKLYKFFLKKLISLNTSNYEINFLTKKLIISFLNYYNFQIKKLKFLSKRRASLVSLNTIRKNLISKKELFLLKQLLYKLNINKNKNIIKFKLQNQFIMFLLKYNKVIINKKENYFLKRLIIAYFKNNTKLSITKKNLIYYKKASILIRSKSKNSKTFKLYQKLIGLFIKNGYKFKALKIVEGALKLTSSYLNLSVNSILLKVFNKLKTSVESKKIRVRRSFHFVPFPVNFKRKIYLIAKWILVGVEKQKIKKSTDFKLYSELVKIIRTKHSISYKSKRYNIYKSLQNKSNLHFRW